MKLSFVKNKLAGIGVLSSIAIFMAETGKAVGELKQVLVSKAQDSDV